MSTVQHVHPVVDEATRRRLGRRAQLLAGASVTYNVVEAVIAITAGLVAGSVALIGFGLDSVVEVSSGLIILWQFRHRLPQSRERQALRMMALSFFALAAYVSFESVRALLSGHEPESSAVGIGLAAASLAIMPFLSCAQRRTGKALGSNAVVADSTQTLLCTYLSAVLLVGLILNATLGWSWADPVAGLVIALVAVKEGRAAWRGEGCCASGHTDAPTDEPASIGGGCAGGCPCCAPAGPHAVETHVVGTAATGESAVDEVPGGSLTVVEQRSPLSRNVTWSLALVTAFVVVVAVVVLVVEGRGRAETVSAGQSGSTVRDSSHVLSTAPPGAPVLVEFLDLECEACAAWYPHVEALREEYDGRVTFVARYFPLPGHRSAVDAAIAVEAAAQQGKMETMYHRMYQTQTAWGEAPTSQKDLFRTFAQDLGLDMGAFDRAVADPATLARVQADVDDGLDLGVQGTPTFFLDDRRIDPSSPDEMRRLLDAALDD